MTSVLEQAMALSIDEKLQLIGALWDNMAIIPETIPVPDWQILQLERRIESQRENPQLGQTWGEVKREIVDGKTQRLDCPNPPSVDNAEGVGC